jgi:hypothetical protein
MGPKPTAVMAPMTVPMVIAPVNSLRLHPNSSVMGFSSTLHTGKVSAVWLKLARATTPTMTHP